MVVQNRNAVQHFTIETFLSLFDCQTNNARIEATVELADSNPVRLYYFMQRYAYFNSFAGSLVARLASSIGLSYKMFQTEGVHVIDQADRGLEIAAKVLLATIDEHADAGAQNVPHRTLAQATLQAVGEYAQLNETELNKITNTPDWMKTVVTNLIGSYQGEINNIEALVTAIGFHLGSELLADQEYSLIDKVVRHTHRGVGFDAWLKGKQVTIAGKRLSPWYWIVVHGKHNASGVEAEHFQFALDALNLLAQNRPESNETILKWASKGFLDFATLQQQLFVSMEAEMTSISVNT